jgi:small-conductance mechanosensitive channel
LIGASLQEVLSSIIFLFIKHPFDVGDRITLLTDKEDPEIYKVEEIQLLTTIFLDAQECRVYVPNPIINSLVNHSRSAIVSESFSFNVVSSTTCFTLEEIREKMMAFLKRERRYFLLRFDLSVVGGWTSVEHFHLHCCTTGQALKINRYC